MKITAVLFIVIFGLQAHALGPGEKQIEMVQIQGERVPVAVEINDSREILIQRADRPTDAATNPVQIIQLSLPDPNERQIYVADEVFAVEGRLFALARKATHRSGQQKIFMLQARRGDARGARYQKRKLWQSPLYITGWSALSAGFWLLGAAHGEPTSTACLAGSAAFALTSLRKIPLRLREVRRQNCGALSAAQATEMAGFEAAIHIQDIVRNLEGKIVDIKFDYRYEGASREGRLSAFEEYDSCQRLLLQRFMELRKKENQSPAD